MAQFWYKFKTAPSSTIRWGLTGAVISWDREADATAHGGYLLANSVAEKKTGTAYSFNGVSADVNRDKIEVFGRAKFNLSGILIPRFNALLFGRWTQWLDPSGLTHEGAYVLAVEKWDEYEHEGETYDTWLCLARLIKIRVGSDIVDYYVDVMREQKFPIVDHQWFNMRMRIEDPDVLHVLIMGKAWVGDMEEEVDGYVEDEPWLGFVGAHASDYDTGHPPGDAVDEDTDTLWRQALPQQVEGQLSPNATAVNELTLYNATTLHEAWADESWTKYAKTGADTWEEGEVEFEDSDSALHGEPIHRVRLRVVCKGTAVDGSVSPFIRVGGVYLYYGDSRVMSEADTEYVYIDEWEKNPSTNVAWEWSEIDALNAGVELLAPIGGEAQCAWVRIEVDYGETGLTEDDFPAWVRANIGDNEPISRVRVWFPLGISGNLSVQVRLVGNSGEKTAGTIDSPSPGQWYELSDLLALENGGLEKYQYIYVEQLSLPADGGWFGVSSIEWRSGEYIQGFEIAARHYGEGEEYGDKMFKGTGGGCHAGVGHWYGRDGYAWADYGWWDVAGFGTNGEDSPPPVTPPEINIPLAAMSLVPFQDIQLSYGVAPSIPYATLAVFSLYYRHLLPPFPVRPHYRPRPLRVLDPQTTRLKAEIDAYDTVQIKRRFHNAGSFNAELPRAVPVTSIEKRAVFGGSSYTYWNRAYNQGATYLREKYVPQTERREVGDAIQDGDLIMADNNPYKVHIVEHREIALHEKGKGEEFWYIQGAHLEGILRRRITIPPDGNEHIILHAVETAMKEYLDYNALDLAEAARQIEQLNVLVDRKLGTVKRWRTRYDNLEKLVSEMSRISGMGWTVYVDLTTRQWVFEVFEGLKRYEQNPWRAPVVLSPDFDSTRDMELWENEVDSRNAIYVAGQGQGEERVVLVRATLMDREVPVFGGSSYTYWNRPYNRGFAVDHYTTEEVPAYGRHRREAFQDARHIADVNDLEARGDELLEELSPEEFLKAGVFPEKPYRYSRHWDLGDIVTVRNRRWNVATNACIIEVDEYWEPYSFTLEVVFARNLPMLYDVWKREIGKMHPEGTK